LLVSSKDLEYSIERALKHYSSLFVLPSYRRITLLTLFLCVTGSILTLSLLAGTFIVFSLQFGVLLFLLSAISDLILRQAFLKSDPIYNLRRCAALSMFSLLLWFGFILLGSLLTRFTSWGLWFDLFSIGFAAVCILRLIVLSSTSFASYLKMLCASIAQPTLCLISMFYVASFPGYALENILIVGFFPLSIAVSVLTTHVFISSVNDLGLKAFQTPTTIILKAFLANWMEDLTAPIESLFERFGKEKTIDFSLLGFEAQGNFKSVVVVPSFHPGPFKNVGSSLLPFMIQEALEKKFRCVAAVPHGLFGHEFDLASQQQNQKVLEGVLSSADLVRFTSGATGFVRIQEGVAGASCQIFGDCALLTLTLAPETTEDFPQEIGDFILDEAVRFGLAHTIVVNAHNSIDSPFEISSSLESLKKAASEALRRASEMEFSPFEVGAAKIVPQEFSVEDGMGLGGICALVVKVGKQVSAYVTIDGNNMVSGLRDKILASLRDLGVYSGEVLTTDTHAVNAVVMTARGYHPLGEAISHEKLIGYVKDAVTEALNAMEPASAAWCAGAVPNVKVIGETQIEQMPFLADKSVQKSKKISVPLFTAAGLALVALLFAL
jgi:putative membrane protein